jgi:hypothetical protein
MSGSRIGLALLLALAVMGAGAAENTLPNRTLEPRGTGIAPPTRIPDAATVSPLPAGTPVALANVPRSVRRAVVADAARRFGVAESAVVLTRAEQVTWNDGSIGCAEPGGMYTQNLVPGYLVIARTSEGELAYHTDSRTLVASCGAGRPVPANRLSDKTPVRGDDPRTQPPAPNR